LIICSDYTCAVNYLPPLVSALQLRCTCFIIPNCK